LFAIEYFKIPYILWYIYSHAHYCSNDFKSAANAFQRGLDLDPSNANLKTGLQSAQSRLPKETEEDVDNIDDNAAGTGVGAGGMADMMRNMGMGGGAGGMPDLSSMLNNPQIMQMAQQMMGNGGLERLMANPALQNMVSLLIINGDRQC
jgi:small glutamine-rich tetratricopeptide repeat-containing protein alpha